MTMRGILRHTWLLLVLGIGTAGATELVYRPISPGFGGSPFNGNYVLGVAEANERQRGPRPQLFDDPSQQFVRTLQASLMGDIGRRVAEAIFGENARDEGRFVFGDITVTFSRGIESVRIDILDAATGRTTTIEVPLLQGP